MSYDLTLVERINTLHQLNTAELTAKVLSVHNSWTRSTMIQCCIVALCLMASALLCRVMLEVEKVDAGYGDARLFAEFNGASTVFSSSFVRWQLDHCQRYFPLSRQAINMNEYWKMTSFINISQFWSWYCKKICKLWIRCNLPSITLVWLYRKLREFITGGNFTNPNFPCCMHEEYANLHTGWYTDMHIHVHKCLVYVYHK